VADEISQLIAEVAAETGDDQISQAIVEVAADSGLDQLSQLIAEVASSSGLIQISQLTIELARGPEVIPPEDNPASIFVFGIGGLVVNWWIVPQLSDSGIELRDKVIKSFRATGKFTNPKFQVYGYGPQQDINVDDIEEGVNSRTGAVVMADTTQVQQSKRFQVNVPNSMLHTVRLQGMYPGTGERDRVDEIVYEVSQQGIRR
jgi:hypothetical protein